MDQVKIGKFISDERKEKGYTQKQLSELLGISDKTISKWECGNGFPEEKVFGMCIVQDDLSIMYCISSEMIRHLFRNWIL